MRSYSRAYGATVYGAEAKVVEIQVAVWGEDEVGEVRFHIVGLPDSALKEGRQRIQSAIAHGQWDWPFRSVTVNLAPATARKEGASLELGVALGVLAASRVVLGPSAVDGLLCVGELGLDGTVRAVRGTLACVEAARKKGLRRAIVPRGNASEAAAVPGMRVVAIDTLEQAVGHLADRERISPEPPTRWEPLPEDPHLAVAVRGQRMGRRAAEVAAAGGHNVILWGPPGAGKTLLARQIAGWMPPLTYEEAVESSRIHSVAGLLQDGLLRRRPFRAPHHTTSIAGLVGGGQVPRPGELSLAHLGVLFLDELPEFPRPALEALRQPLEEGRLVVGRAAGRARFPADVVLVAATNPCPCGWSGEEHRCKCTQREVRRYMGRVSGPLRDRFDLDVRIHKVDAQDLVKPLVDPDEAIGSPERRQRAWSAQRRRARRLGLARPWNARIPGGLLPNAVEPTPKARDDLVSQAGRLGLTGRGVHRVLRVARTLADMEGSEPVEPRHVLEAIGLRSH